MFQKAYGARITRLDVFHYIYGLLHVPAYRESFANNLSKQFPNVPLVADKWFRVNKMKLAGSRKSPDRTSVVYNDNITVCGIPEEAWEYEVNGKAALKWVIEQQCVSTHGKSGIENDANIYATETAGDPSYLLKLLARVIRVSIETTRIIKSLPDPKWRGVDPEI